MIFTRSRLNPDELSRKVSWYFRSHCNFNMNKIHITWMALMLSISASATIRTVNNINGLEADHTTISDAIGASLDGDTIYVQPSPNDYGSATLNKRLVLMGAGHNPTFSPYESWITTLTIGTGSGNSVVKGLSIRKINSNPSITANNVLVSGCKLSNPGESPLDLGNSIHNGWIFEGCVMQSGSNIPISFGNLDANLIIRNCFAMSIGAPYIFYQVPSGTLIDHNILIGEGASIFYGITAGQNVLHSNNIVTTTATTNYGVDYSCSACTFNNNLLWNANSSFNTPPSGSGNVVNVNPAFTVFSFTVDYSYNWDLHVSDNSPAQNAATDGTDIGIYGGIFNFNHFGIDGGSPHIVDFSLGSSTAPQGGTITIHLNANGSGQ